MISALGSFLSIAVTFLEGHPDIVKSMWHEITTLLDRHAASASPASAEAIQALQTGIVAAAANAVSQAHTPGSIVMAGVKAAADQYSTTLKPGVPK